MFYILNYLRLFPKFFSISSKNCYFVKENRKWYLFTYNATNRIDSGTKNIKFITILILDATYREQRRKYYYVVSQNKVKGLYGK